MKVGRIIRAQRRFSQEDFDRFAALSGDDNPIHVDPEFAAQTSFGRTVAHGMLLYSAVSGVLSDEAPGMLQLEQELMFPSPTYAGENVTIQLEVTQVQTEERWADLTTAVVRPDGNKGLRGRTRVLLPGAIPFGPFHTHSTAPTVPATPVAALKALKVGQRAETRRTFTAQDLAEYAELTGDANPIFSDADYARQQGLERPVVPGGLLGGLFSYLLGTRLPGQGTNYLKQLLVFPAPAYTARELTATVEIIRIRPEKQLVNLSTVCTDAGGQVVCQGEALVLVKDVMK